jgi:hypothetical protein
MQLRRVDFLRAALGALFGASLFSNTASAASGCCRRCGHPEATRVCRKVCEMKKVKVALWGVDEEDFCLPGPSRPGCKNQECVSDPQENEKTPSYLPKLFSWRDWTPSGAPTTLHTKKKLMKKTVTKTVPTYRWIVEDLCVNCVEQLEQTEGGG